MSTVWKAIRANWFWAGFDTAFLLVFMFNGRYDMALMWACVLMLCLIGIGIKP